MIGFNSNNISEKRDKKSKSYISIPITDYQYQNRRMDMNTAGTIENDRAFPTDFMSLENDGMRNKRMIKTRGY